MKTFYSFMIFMLVVVVMISFFLPWLNVESTQISSITKFITGKSAGYIDKINGFRIPILANGGEARFMISVIKIFSPAMRSVPSKSFFIWILPLLAVLIFGASYFFGRSRFVSMLIAIIGTSVFAIGLYKISVTDLDKFVLTVHIGYGLWFTLYAYLAMGIIGALRYIQLTVIAKKHTKQELKEKKIQWQIKTVKAP